MDDDRSLIAAIGELIAVPRQAPADSFVLHAPLELLARAGLLPRVRPEAREAAREQIRALGAKYEAAGDPVDPPDEIEVDSIDDGVHRLLAALQAGELDDVDRLAVWLGARIDAIGLQRALAEPVAASLAAAAHASILLDLLPRLPLAAHVPVAIVRGPARELARHPDWRLHWFEDPSDDVPSTSLTEALLDVPMLGTPGSDFIYPIMNQAEESGLATKLLSSVANVATPDARAAGRELARIAVWSMLQEPPDYAPYGWSHCLTMPQSVIALAGVSDPHTAVVVAATHVVGFRAALGQRPLDPTAEPESAAVATVFHAPREALTGIETDLATGAALHEDAHLVKYTLACFDAAAADPANRNLFLAAATALHEWWGVA